MCLLFHVYVPLLKMCFMTYASILEYKTHAKKKKKILLQKLLSWAINKYFFWRTYIAERNERHNEMKKWDKLNKNEKIMHLTKMTCAIWHAIICAIIILICYALLLLFSFSLLLLLLEYQWRLVQQVVADSLSHRCTTFERREGEVIDLQVPYSVGVWVGELA